MNSAKGAPTENPGFSQCISDTYSCLQAAKACDPRRKIRPFGCNHTPQAIYPSQTLLTLFLILPPSSTRHCYQKSTSEILHDYSPALRLLFNQYAYGDGTAGNPLSSRSHMGIDEWRLLLSDLALVDNFAFGERQATAAIFAPRMGPE